MSNKGSNFGEFKQLRIQCRKYLFTLYYLWYRGYLTFRKKSVKGCSSCPANKNV